MEDNIKSFPDRICRICLSESVNLKSLFDKIDEGNTMADILGSIVNSSISTKDTLPKHICSDCETLLHKTDSFKRLCIESEAKLMKIFCVKNSEKSSNRSSKKIRIKPEILIETKQSEVLQCTYCCNQYLNQSLLDAHVKESHFSQKVLILGDPCFSNNDLLPTGDTIKTELEIETDFSNDIEDTDFEPQTEFKEENIDTKLEIIIRQTKPKKEKPECDICKVKFSCIKSLRRHQLRKHNIVMEKNIHKYECTLCMRKFFKKSSLETHMLKHDRKDNIKFTCNVCKREFKHRAHLDNHILNIHTKGKGHACEICLNEFSSQESLNIHKEMHSKERNHICKMCNKAFYMLSTLTDHIRTHTGERPYLCSVCGRGFSQKTNLAQHTRRHLGLKPFKCSSCDKSFVSKGELDAHMRKHSGAHPFICDDCGSGFTTSSSLVKHRRTHTGERPYACDLCPMKFAASGTLKNHRRTHTNERPYQCKHCAKAFIQKNDLDSHERCHTGERPYVCATCGQAFRKSSGLKTHVKMHGKELSREVNLTVLQGVNVMLSGMQCHE